MSELAYAIKTIQIDETEYDVTNSLWCAVNDLNTTVGSANAGLVKDVDFLKSRLTLNTSKGNVELSAAGLTKPDGEGGGAASLNLVSDGKITSKGEFNLEGDLVLPVEISKKGKVTIAGIDKTGAVKTNTTIDEFKTTLSSVKSIKIAIAKNNIIAPEAMAAKDTTPTAYQIAYNKDQIVNSNLCYTAEGFAEGDVIAEVSLYELCNLVDKVAALEERVAYLENAQA